jgi:hypothetical protein
MRQVIPFAAAAVLLVLGAPQAQARFFDPALAASSIVEQAACRIVRERVVRPSGAFVYRERRVCGPDFGSAPGCRVVRERIVRPNGAVVFRSVRRCG